MIYLTRRERFNAAHRLYKKEWSDERNFEVFGKCSNPNWHGHNYELFVTIKGETNLETGFVINLKELSKIVKEKVIEKMTFQDRTLCFYGSLRYNSIEEFSHERIFPYRFHRLVREEP